MKMRKNARLTPLRREEMARSVLAGEMSRVEAVASFGVTANTVSKWVRRVRTKSRTPRTNGGAELHPDSLSGSGTALGPMRPRSSARPTSRRGRACTTGIGRTPPRGRGRPSAACGWIVITC